MVVANEKLGVSKTGEKQVKGTVGDFKAHSQHRVSEIFNASKRDVVLSVFFSSL